MSTGENSGPVAFIGLGNIGAPMARRLLDIPGGLFVVDLSDEAVGPFVNSGATRADTPAQAAERCGRLCVMVNTEDQVRSVLEGEHGIWSGAATSGRAETIVAIHSTISAAGARQMARESEPHGVTLVDAPVSGGAIGAAEGSLAIMSGGTRPAIDAMRSVFERYGSSLHRFGEVGAGTEAKVVRNLVTFASFAAVGEALRLAEAAGLDLNKLGQVVRHSDGVTGGAGAIMLRNTTETLDEADGLRPIFEHTASLGGKDLELARGMGIALGINTPFADLASTWLPVALGLAPPAPFAADGTNG